MKLHYNIFLIVLFFFVGSELMLGQQTENSSKNKTSAKFFEANRLALKVSLTSLLLDKGEYITTAFEYKKSNRHSYQITIGLKGSNPNTSTYVDSSIGESVTVPERSNGFFYKFSSRYYSSKAMLGYSRYHPINLQGLYIEPEFVMGFYNKNSINRTFVPTTLDTLITDKIRYFGLTTNLGYQSNRGGFLFDLQFGFGVGYDNLERDTESYLYDFNHRGLYKKNGNFSLAFQFDAKIGGIF